MLLKSKAKNLNSEWIFGYPFKKNDEIFIIDENNFEHKIIEETICYHLGAFDKKNTPVYTNDIIDDFGGGVFVKDPNSINADFPDYIQTGNTERLGEVILKDGTIRIRTKDAGYDFNLSDGYKFSDMEVRFNAYDNY